ncbi:MAG: hypothetical protein Q4G51_06015 [Dermatophilus congolensis]|nr:hypothetical protein [Dermatophilus congolensis]
MIAALELVAYVTAGLSALLLLMAIPPRVPRAVSLAVIGLAELAVLVGVGIDVATIVGGRQVPEMLTHVSYLLTTPLIIPAGFALTYKKLDRWGLVIVGIASVIATFMVIRQLQTMGVPFGYINVR